MKARGYILYKGPSLIDGNPIVVIGIMETSNGKTGDMVQVFILADNGVEPHHAVKDGSDYSICGDCVHRPAKQGSCYVTVFQAPLSIYRAYKRGVYSTNIDQFYSRITDRRVRMGAYGDPAAAPTSVWSAIADRCSGTTGYTHQFERPGFDMDILEHVMASADTESQAHNLASMGVRYFRTIVEGAPTIDREVECLSDSKGMACADCLLCDGGSKGKSVYINIHGSKASKFNPNLIAVGV